MNVSNWGNYPVVDASVSSPSTRRGAVETVLAPGAVIARGLGRCYGDSSLGQRILSTLRLNRMESFDDQTGRLQCEAGVSIEEILDVFVPRGWFVPVTPGTKFVTIGGAIASNVHGKNHHTVGSFGDHVDSLDLLCADGTVRHCSRSEHADLFRATCGGMGLTGVILSATIRLRKIPSAYIYQESIKARNLEEVMAAFEESQSWPYSVAWIDCLAKGGSLGRSILFLGDHATQEQLKDAGKKGNPYEIRKRMKLNVPIFLPNVFLSPMSVRLFNTLVYMSQWKRKKIAVIDYDTYFYPLDRIHHWNRIYGRRGFTQYQLVLPKQHSGEGIKKVLQEVASYGTGSFLAVLKLFGKQEGVLSFPMEGYTLTLDFPIGKKLFPFLDRLDDIVAGYGGRVYLTKDCRLEASGFEKMYPGATEFRAAREGVDPDRHFRSLQSDRVGLS